MGSEGNSREPRIDRIDAYVRDHTPLSSPRDEVLTRLRALDERDIIGTYSVSSVPTAVDREGASNNVENLYDTILEWTEGVTYTVDGPFQVRTWTNAFTEEAGETLVVPVVTLTVYVDDELVAAVPCECTDTEQPITVLSYLDALLRGEDLLGTIPTRRASSTERESEPIT